MIFSGENSDSAVMPGILVLIVGRENGHRRSLGVGRQKSVGMHHRTKRDVAKIRRSIVVTDHAVGEQGERVGVIPVKFSRSLNADTSTPVGMVNKDKFTPVGVSFFKGWEFAFLGTKWFTLFYNGCKDSRSEYKSGERKK